MVLNRRAKWTGIPAGMQTGALDQSSLGKNQAPRSCTHLIPIGDHSQIQQRLLMSKAPSNAPAKCLWSNTQLYLERRPPVPPNGAQHTNETDAMKARRR